MENIPKRNPDFLHHHLLLNLEDAHVELHAFVEVGLEIVPHDVELLRLKISEM